MLEYKLLTSQSNTEQAQFATVQFGKADIYGSEFSKDANWNVQRLICFSGPFTE